MPIWLPINGGQTISTSGKQGGRDHTAEQLAVKMDSIIEELSNSDQNLVLNKLMDYPVISGYNQINARIMGKAVGNRPLSPDRIPGLFACHIPAQTFTARYQDGTKDKQ